MVVCGRHRFDAIQETTRVLWWAFATSRSVWWGLSATQWCNASQKIPACGFLATEGPVGIKAGNISVSSSVHQAANAQSSVNHTHSLKRKAIAILKDTSQAESAAVELEEAFLEKSSRRSRTAMLNTLCDLADVQSLRLFPLGISTLKLFFGAMKQAG